MSQKTGSETNGQTSRQGKPELPDHPERILVADDDHIIATGLSANLADLGYSVVGPARDGQEAVELARQLIPDLALMDIRMPRLDGLQAAEVIYRELGIPVVIVSAFSDPELVSTAQSIGVFGYLLKPVSADQVRVNLSIAWGRFAEAVNSQSEVEQLRNRLEERKFIEQAKWIIVKRKGIAEDEAMRLLQKQARNNRRPLVEVAQGVIENADLFGA